MKPRDYELLIQRALGVPDAVTSANRNRIAALRLVRLAEVIPRKATNRVGSPFIDAVVPKLIEHAYGLAQQGEFDYAFAHVDEPTGQDGSTESVAVMLDAQ